MKLPKPNKIKLEPGGTEFRVHPAAAIFPMMPEAELQELADDIKRKGLLHPIIMGRDEHGEYIVDGRNRLKACAIAGVEPKFVYLLNGEDPRGVVASANVARRNMKQGQLAMAVAMIYPEPDKPGRGNKGKSEEASGFSQKRLQQARQVLAYSKAWAHEVLVDRMGLDEALDRVREDRMRNETLEAKRERLLEEAPDLSAMINDDRFTIAQAWAAFEQRKREKERQELEEKEVRERGAQSLLQFLIWADRPHDRADLDFEFLAKRGEKVSPQRLDAAIQYLSAWRDAIVKMEQKAKAA